jgi:hypothetical protein
MRKLTTLLMLLLLSASVISAQDSKTATNPVGKWKFEAPYAPEGYNTGTIDIGFAEEKYSSTISFTGSDYKIPGEKTVVEKGNVTFIVMIEGGEVAISLSAAEENKMTGKAVYSEGEIPLTLTRDIPKN